MKSKLFCIAVLALVSAASRRVSIGQQPAAPAPTYVASLEAVDDESKPQSPVLVGSSPLCATATPGNQRVEDDRVLESVVASPTAGIDSLWREGPSALGPHFGESTHTVGPMHVTGDSFGEIQNRDSRVATSIWYIDGELHDLRWLSHVISQRASAIWCLCLDKCSIPHAPIGGSEPEREPRSEPRIHLEALEPALPAMVLITGSGVAGPIMPQISLGTGPIEIGREDRLMLIGGPGVMAAVDRTAIGNSGNVAKTVRTLESSFFNEGYEFGLWDFLYSWDRSEGWREPYSHAANPASMSSVVAPVAWSQDCRRLIIAGDDDTLHVCYRSTGKELCEMKQSPDGVWRVVNTSNRFLSVEDFAETSADSGRGEPDRSRLDAIDPFLRHYLLAMTGDRGELFSFSLGGACR